MTEMGVWLTDAAVMHKAAGSLRNGPDPILCCGNLTLKEVKRGEEDGERITKEDTIIIKC